MAVSLAEFLVLLNVNPQLAEDYRGRPGLEGRDLIEHRRTVLSSYGVPGDQAEILLAGDARGLIDYLRSEYEAGRFFVIIC